MIESRFRLPVEAHPAMLWRGALALTAEPPEIFYRDAPIRLSPAETAVMALLVRRGRAPHSDIADALAQAGASIASLDVIIYRIRRKFAGVGARDPIETHRRRGLVLRVEPDARGSTALWIGSGDYRRASDDPGYGVPIIGSAKPQAQRPF